MGITVSPIALEKGLRTTFLRKAIEMAPRMLGVLATAAPSDSPSEKYGWLGDVPQVQEFLAERVIKGLSEASYTLVNRKWESTIGFKREDIEDDINQMFDIRIGQLAQRATNHPWKLLVETIELGTVTGSGEGYDGVTYYNDAHPNRGGSPGSGVQDNLLAGTGTTAAALKVDFQSAQAALKKFLDEAGEPFRESLGQLVIVHPVEMEVAFEELFDTLGLSSADNVLTGKAILHSEPRLTDIDNWYMFMVGGAIKPLVFQDRIPLSFEAMEQGSGDNAFMRDLYVYGTRARYNTGYLFWQDSVKTVN